jgi:hypothetical protein
MSGASRKLIFASLFVISLSLVLGSGVADAATTVTATHLTINRTPTGSVHSGTVITIFGRLRSERASCRSHQKIRLFSLVGVPTPTQVAATFTDANGRYSFTRTVTSDSAFQTHFAGSVSGTHPNTHVCALSTSAVLRVNVIESSVFGTSGAGAAVLGASGSAADALTSFTGGALRFPFTSFALLLVSGVAALAMGRRRTPTTSSA